MDEKEEIEIDDFNKLDMRVGTVTDVEKVEGSDKLYKIIADVGEKEIQIVSSLADYYTEDDLMGQKIIVLVNLKPAKIRGVLSEGMLLCAENEHECVLLTVEKDVRTGTSVT